MSEFIVKVKSSDQTFTVRPNEIILDAAILQGINIPYSCRNGTCRTCIFEIKEGIVQAINVEECLISPNELELNKRLLCMSLCKSDVIMEKVSPRRRAKITGS
ncbi:2Fe-2S iron-sulfur cluster-binding protein [Neobacillus sp. NPDC058068]|uniref:2Fe-2S iron-sulfur cluster-binding protein n=1 Tax=Neobacillus sp. NPDC058068 TaxID=3346325 RepID=UPI0036D7B80B